jgi:MFS transporter, DHA1 family, inner membrane transport protein
LILPLPPLCRPARIDTVARHNPKAAMPAPDTKTTLWALLLGNLVIGTGVLLPAGMLTAFMADFAVDAGLAGQLMLAGGLVVGIGAPLLAGWTSRIDRRHLLSFALALYAAGHVGATLTTDFTALLVLRAITVIGAAIFTPQAAATVGLIVPAAGRAGAIAFIFIGWSLASVAGIPLGSLLGDAIGWQSTYFGLAALSAATAAIVWRTVPQGLVTPRIDLAAWGRVFRNPVLLIVLCVTLLSMAGQFTLFTYLSPILKGPYGASANAVAITFLIVGGLGVVGNFIGARVAGRLGVDLTIGIALGLMAAGLVVIALGYGNLAVFLLGGCLWGFGGFASNSLQQSRLVALAPSLASATVALNTSFVYLGQSLGSAAGGLLIRDFGAAMPWAAVAFLLAALGLSVIAAKGVR